MRIKTAPEGQEVAKDYPTPDGKTMINDENLIEWYNSVNGATWVAGHNDVFNGMTFDDARPILGTALSHVSEHLNNTLSDSVYAALGDAPAEFDARTKWSGLIHPIRNQLHCGSCWAFSASEVLSDRVAIANGKESPVLSAEDMVSCDTKDNGCGGGRLPWAWEYLTSTGIVTDACFPYTSGGGQDGTCRSACVNGGTFTKQRTSSAYAINGVANIQKDLQTNGPIQVAFMVYESFMSYKSGVYTPHWWEFQPKGGHAVKFMGWGVEDNTDYWLVANSWGTGWGLDGFFKIKRGDNTCRIETLGPPYAGAVASESAIEADVGGGNMHLTYKTCGGAVTVNDVEPTTIALGKKTTVTASGTTSVEVTGGNFQAHVKAGWIPIASCSGKIGPPGKCELPLGVGTLGWNAVPLPIHKGPASLSLYIDVAGSIPASLASTTTHLTATDESGKSLLCMDIDLNPAASVTV